MTLREVWGCWEPTGDGGPCLGRLISQSSQTALLGAPQHCTAAVGVRGAICHREPEIGDTAQVRPAVTMEKKRSSLEEKQTASSVSQAGTCQSEDDFTKKGLSKEAICSPSPQQPAAHAPQRVPQQARHLDAQESRADAPHEQVSAPRPGGLRAGGQVRSPAQNPPPGPLSCISAPPSPRMMSKRTDPSRWPSTAIAPLVPRPTV